MKIANKTIKVLINLEITWMVGNSSTGDERAKINMLVILMGSWFGF